MKNSILLFITLFTYFCATSVSNAQEFKSSDKYSISNERGIGQEEEGATLVDLVFSDNATNVIATLEFFKAEAFHEMRISVLENPELNRINEVIKLEFEYNGYSQTIDTYYFLVNDKGNYIALPKIAKVYDDITEPIVDYVFPTQKHGQEETIIKAIFYYTNNYKTEKIKVLQSIVWNDDDFDYEDAITAIN